MDQPKPTPTHIRGGPTIGIPSRLHARGRAVPAIGGTVLAIAPKELLNHRFDWIVGTDRQQMPTGLVGQWSKIRVECRCLLAVGIPNDQ